MIITECPTCDAPLFVPLSDEHLCQWQKVLCKTCLNSCYVEHRHFDGLTVDQEAFEEMQRTGKRP